MIREKETPTIETPMMRQYLSVKEKYSKEIVFFRMGDFYETFFDDAKAASDLLGIALTSRSKEKNAVPMAGVPVRAADSYVARLLKAGRRVLRPWFPWQISQSISAIRTWAMWEKYTQSGCR